MILYHRIHIDEKGRLVSRHVRIYTYMNFKKFRNTKLHENPVSGSLIVTCGQTLRRCQVYVAISTTAKEPYKTVQVAAPDSRGNYFARLERHIIPRSVKMCGNSKLVQ